MRAFFVILALMGAAAGPSETLAPWGTNHHSMDAPKRHVVEIATGRHAYVNCDTDLILSDAETRLALGY